VKVDVRQTAGVIDNWCFGGVGDKRESLVAVMPLLQLLWKISFVYLYPTVIVNVALFMPFLFNQFSRSFLT
jgi:hypothetical protein